MDVTPLIKSGSQIIQSYAGGKFRISGEIYESALIVTAEQTTIWQDVDNVDALKLSDFEILKTLDVDVVLLGSGAQMKFLPADIRDGLGAFPFSVDVMDTGAACRTYNVLMAEGRRVAAALLPCK